MSRSKITLLQKFPEFSLAQTGLTISVYWRGVICSDTSTASYYSTGFKYTQENFRTVSDLCSRVAQIALAERVKRTHGELLALFNQLKDGVVRELVSKDKGKYALQSKFTVKEIYYATRDDKKGLVKASSYHQKWEVLYENFLRPDLEKRVSRDIITSLVESPRLNNFDKKILMKAMQAMYFKMSGDASETDILFHAVELMSKRRDIKVRDEQIKIGYYKQDEINIILAHFEGLLGANSPYFRAIKTMALTGMRPGEVVGLQYWEIDLPAKEILICQQLSRETKQLTSTKTGKSRTFKMNDELYSFVFEVMKKQPSQGRDTFFCHENFQPINQKKISAIWYSSNGLPSLLAKGHIQAVLPLYNLRHSFITNALLRGNDIDNIVAMTGHTTKIAKEHYVSSSIYGQEALK